MADNNNSERWQRQHLSRRAALRAAILGATIPGALYLAKAAGSADAADDNIYIPGAPNFLELGHGWPGKEANAGKITYRQWSDALDIVGAGTTPGYRKVKIWDDLYVQGLLNLRAYIVDPEVPRAWTAFLYAKDVNGQSKPFWKDATGTAQPLVARSATLLVAASNASPQSRLGADFVCDGIADEVEIQAAIDALPSQGGRVLLSEGTFNIAAMISITRDNCLLEGQGMGDHREGYADGITVLSVADSIPDTPDPDHPGGVAIRVEQPSTYGYVEISKIKFYYTRPAASGIWVHNSKNVWLSDLLFTHTMMGFEFYECSSCTARNVWIRAYGTGPRHYGAFVRLTGDSTLDDVHVEGSDAGKAGICLEHSVGNRLSRCWAATSDIGIELNDSHTVSIDDCWADYNEGAGLLVHAGSHRVRVSGGSFYNNGRNAALAASLRAGIYIDDSNDIVVTGAYLGSWHWAGSPTQQYGVYETGTADYNSIAHCNVRGNVTAGILLSGANSKAQNNIGHVTENSGTAPIASGSTYFDVAHGLSVTPNAKDISVTPTNSLGNASKFWISNVGASTFRINVNTYPGSATATFAWRAEML